MSNDWYISDVPDNRNTTVTEAASGLRPDGSKRRRGVRVTTAALAAAVGLALGGGLLTSAADAGAATTSATGSTGSTSTTGPPTSGRMPVGCTPPSAVGTVKSVGSDGFVVSTSEGGTSTVDVTSATTYLDRGVANASLTNVTAGEHVGVVGSSKDGTVTATTVLIGEPPTGTGHGPGPAGHGPGPSGGTPKGAPPPQGTGAEA
jgi:hypothetical protein